ncbi:MAG: lipid-A-disaccharide synthase-related protein [Bacillota bacterium]
MLNSFLPHAGALYGASPLPAAPGVVEWRPGFILTKGASTGIRPPTLLFFSNGHGEDAVGAAIAAEVRSLAPGVRLLGAPIVGSGLPYRRGQVTVVTPTKPVPSGGFIGIRRLPAVWQDLRAGLIRLHLRQALALRHLAPTVDLVVGIGDRVVLYVTRLLIHRPLVMVAIADSVHLTGNLEGVWTSADRRLMRRYARRVFTRDGWSAELLRRDGVPAEFTGNPMMDAFEGTGIELGVRSAGEPLIGLLPGSREEAYRNFRLILSGVAALQSMGLVRAAFAAAWPDSLSLERLESHLPGSGWTLRRPPARGNGGSGPHPGGHVATLHHTSGSSVAIVTGRFGDIISQADVIVGLSGTGNEQAAGLGKPVVICPGTGPQVTAELVRRQTLLLGEAVRPVEPRGEAIAAAVLEILRDPELRARMGDEGRRRMGPRGAARRIAEAVIEELERIRPGCTRILPDRPGKEAPASAS